jgi:hypothetical protein
LFLLTGPRKSSSLTYHFDFLYLIFFNMGKYSHEPPFEMALETYHRFKQRQAQRAVSQRQSPVETTVGPSATWPDG